MMVTYESFMISLKMLKNKFVRFRTNMYIPWGGREVSDWTDLANDTAQVEID